VCKGEYLLALVSHDAEAQKNYQLPVSLGCVLEIVPAVVVDGGGTDSDSDSDSDAALEGSTDPNDRLTIEWYAPKAVVPHQRYDIFWQLMAAEVGSTDSYQTEIARGSVVLAGLNAGWFIDRTFRSQQMTKMKFSKKLLRKMAEGELGVVSKFVDFGPDLPKLRGR
jgi:hypothetical protein